MLIDATREKCPRCGEVKERTAEHFHFRRDGRVNGYCRDCRRAVNRERAPAPMTEARRAYKREYMRAYNRRVKGVPADRWRGPYRLGRDGAV